MEKAHSAVTASSARQFLEQTLGFGEPIEGGSLKTLFSNREESLYYGSRGSSHASLNAVSKTEWDNKHMVELGRVFVDIFAHPINRVREFLENELAVHGLMLVDAIDGLHGNRLHQIMRVTKGFFDGYQHLVDPSAELITTFILRRQENIQNWNLILRVGVFGKSENVFVEMHFQNIVKGVKNLITDRQIDVTAEATARFLESFGKSSKIFRDITRYELSKMIVHSLLSSNGVAAGTLYTQYYQFLHLNKTYLKDNVDVIQAEKVMEVPLLGVVHMSILQKAIELAQLQLNSYITHNTLEAKIVP